MSTVESHSQLQTKPPTQVVGLDLYADSQDSSDSQLGQPDQTDQTGQSGQASKHSLLRRLGPATALGVIWSALPSFAGIFLLLNMEPIRVALVGTTGSTPQLLMGLSIYAACFIILAGLGCLPTVSQAVLAGYAFGFTLGFPVAMLGFAGASLIGYQLVHHITRNRVESEISRSPRTVMVRDALLHASPKRAILIVSLLRASPSAPFALTNLVLGSLGVSRMTFFAGTILGMIPRTLAAVLIGVSITNWTGQVQQPRWIIVSGIIAMVALLIIIGKVAATTLSKVSAQSS